jgi:hypothetical protein
MSLIKKIKHLLVAMTSVTYNYLLYRVQSRKNKNGFWDDIRDRFIYLEYRDNPFRPLE